MSKTIKLKDLIKQTDKFIFDLDGTLIDSMRVWHEIDKRFLGDRGFELTAEYTNNVKACTMQDAAIYTVNRYGLKETPDEVVRIWDDMVYEAYKSEINLKSGALEVLKLLHESNCKIAIATALSRKNALASLEHNKLTGMIDVVMTLDDLGAPIDKSMPDLYIKVAEKLGSAKDETQGYGEVVVFEDVYVAILGAQKGGFKVCAVYDEVGSGSDWDKMCKTSDYAINTFVELL